MASATLAKAVDISEALTALEPLDADQYFIAFGPAGRQFCGTPNGYSASQLPARVVTDLVSGEIRKVVWASFGSESQSFFFAYQMKDGSPAHRIGKSSPSTLRPFVEYASTTSFELACTLRVQLGNNRSYVAWAGGIWATRNVPDSLNAALCHLSSDYAEDKLKGLRGAVKSGGLVNVAWHDNGTYYLRADQEDSWNFESDVIERGWSELWQGYEQLTPHELANLAHVAIDSHSHTGNTFAFIKKKEQGREADFVVRFEEEDMVSRLQSPPSIDLSTDCTCTEPEDDLVDTTEAPNLPLRETDLHLESCAGSEQLPQAMKLAQHTKGPQAFRWAFSKRGGRPHTTDSWELDLKKGERLKILQDVGKDWFVAQNRLGAKGYVHRSSLDFGGLRMHADPREAYARYAEDTEKLLKPGTLRAFLNLSSYMNACEREVCKPMKVDSAGLRICVHDLHELLKGSGQYSLDFLKTQRNRYHPDKFARYCHPDSRDELKAKAEALFVLFGVLMDWLENPPETAPM